jgi:hypothetical protein
LPSQGSRKSGQRGILPDPKDQHRQDAEPGEEQQRSQRAHTGSECNHGASH